MFTGVAAPELGEVVPVQAPAEEGPGSLAAGTEAAEQLGREPENAR
ncbi:MAG: hypothetical protein QM809_12700 [Gordonia sp. (in: high G+C Gram-positive bacteria)]